MGTLTDKAIKAAIKAAKAGDKQRKISDGEGIYFVIPPRGSPWWRFDYRFEGRQLSLSLGRYGEEKDGLCSLSKARDHATDWRRLIRQGVNPSDTRKAEKIEKQEAATSNAPRLFEVIADEWLGTRIPAQYKGKEQTEIVKLSKTYARDARMVGYLREGKGNADGFGKVEIADVEYAHLLPILKECNHPTRIRLMSAARKITGYARVHKYLPKDRALPFEGIDLSEGFAKHKEKHRPAITDQVRFGQLLRKIELYEGRGDNLVGYALELLALTFVRPGTIADAKWEHFNLKGAVWVVPFERLKMATERSEAGKSEDDYIIPLSRQAVALLGELRKITGDGEYLFPGRGSRTISENTINYALHALGYKDIHCAHGFRSSASTLLNRERVDGRRRFEPELIEMQQDRLDGSTRAIYDRDDRLPERIELMQFWADKIDQMRSSTIMALKVA